MDRYQTPSESAQNELMSHLKRLFSDHFEEENIFPGQIVNINYQQSKGEWSASVTLNYQRATDYRVDTHSAHFTYKTRSSVNGREMYWYCDRGLPGD